MDIDIELEKIIEKYDLDKYDPQYKKYKKSEAAILSLLRNQKGKMAVVSTSQPDLQRFKFMGKDMNIDYFYCPPNKDKYTNYDTAYNFNNLLNVDWTRYVCIMVVSLDGATFVKKWFRKRNIEYSFLYDELEVRGIHCEKEWDSFISDPSTEWWSDSACSWYQKSFILADTIEMLAGYNYTKKISTKYMLLRRLFFRAIYLRDFRFAERCYHDMPDDWDNEHNAWIEIRILLESIYELLSNKTQKDIYMIWTDAVPYDDMNNLPYIMEKGKNGIVFNNIHTVCANTNPSLKAILCGKLPVDEDTYGINWIDEDSSIVISMLKKQGYDFCALSGGLNWASIKNKYRSDKYHESFEPSSMLMWDLWRNIILRDKPTFYMLHSLVESHTPYLSFGITDDIIGNDNLRYKESCKYLNAQYRFFLSRLPATAIKIYMTDHGKTCYKNRNHVYMSIEGVKSKSNEINEMCSYVDFHKILSQIITDNEIVSNEFVKDYVCVQDLDYYNPVFAADTILEHRNLMATFYGFHGIISKKEIYLHFTDGREWFVRRDDVHAPEPNLFGSYIYDESKVKWYREKVHQQEQNMPDFSKKLKYSKYIHKVFENAKEKNYKKRDIINQIVSQYPDNSIYIRLGGSYGRQIYGILSKENQRKIGGVVDLSQDCMCSKYGLPVYSSVDELPDTAKIILPSNENFIDKAEKECAASSHNLQVLNLHEKLKEYGIYTKDCVALFQPSPEDYEVDFPFDDIQY